MILHGDCLEQLKKLDSDSLDSLVTDPPAGISFMGKDWDHHKGGRKEWIAWMTDVMKECLRVLKPGAHGLVWAIPRTSHWTATALEDAGFEVRDVVTHLFGSGFPKSLNVSKAIDKAAGAERARIGVAGKSGSKRESSTLRLKGGEYFATAPATAWQGWGTALKPASEHWILVRKPCSEKTVAANVLKWGTGALNIDASRIETTESLSIGSGKIALDKTGTGFDNYTNSGSQNPQGRFPANLVLDEEAAAMLDQQSGVSKSDAGLRPGNAATTSFSQVKVSNRTTGYCDSGGASRFFYVAKASKKDKGEDNTHPTVKSQALMTYLIRMITPPNGVVLDPFMGSGSTGVAALKAGFKFIGIERDQEYIRIAEKRIESVVVNA